MLRAYIFLLSLAANCMRAALLDAFQDFVPKADPSNKGEKNSLPQRRLARCTNFLCALICLCALCVPQKFSAPQTFAMFRFYFTKMQRAQRNVYDG